MPLLKVLLTYLLLGKKKGKTFRYYVGLTKVNPTSTLLSVALFITILLLVHTQLQLQTLRVKKGQSSYHGPPALDEKPCIPEPYSFILPSDTPMGPERETKDVEVKAISIRRHAQDRLKKINTETVQ